MLVRAGRHKGTCFCGTMEDVAAIVMMGILLVSVGQTVTCRVFSWHGTTWVQVQLPSTSMIVCIRLFPCVSSQISPLVISILGRPLAQSVD